MGEPMVAGTVARSRVGGCRDCGISPLGRASHARDLEHAVDLNLTESPGGAPIVGPPPGDAPPEPTRREKRRDKLKDAVDTAAKQIDRQIR